MMAVVDADSGKVVATPAIGDGPDAAAFDPGRSWRFRPTAARDAYRNQKETGQ